MNNSVNLKIISSLEKIYHNDRVSQDGLSAFSMLKNEKKSFQIAVESQSSFDGKLIIESDFQSINVYSVEYVKSDLPMYKSGTDDYFRFSDDGFYPDLLLPVGKDVRINDGTTVFWVEISPNSSNVGNNAVKISLAKDRTVLASASLDVEVIDCNLDFKDFVYTNWFHTDCLMSYYGFSAFSDEYWRVTENFLKTAAEYGMNCVLTPLFTPPIDTEVGKERPTVQLVDVTVNGEKYNFGFQKLTKWIEVAEKCGIKYFEFSHFFTQWGAHRTPKIMATVNGEYKRIFGWETKSSSKEYRKFLILFSAELKKHLEENHLKDRVFFHVSDEPSFSSCFDYYRASKLIHKLFKDYKIIDALSDFWFYRLKIISNPIPSNDRLDKFLKRGIKTWTYYCSAQNKNFVSNRFFCNSSLRTRVLGYQMYKYDIKGFLHWGYNFYYTQLSKSLVNPYKVTDAGGNFPSGDSFIVYPAQDGTAYHSIRLKVFYDALQDMAALNTLEKLTNKAECLNIIEENGKHSLTFSDYPHCDDWLLTAREKINYKIKENLK